ncbi:MULTISPECIES: class I SAM-dependent methyltransferase [unclassified Parabacteroides]|uniref:class I SAM-dependent methyltransferase n=1 Tax=unclassified Parabacteroides TaxID=2649774 RepID=UPI0024772C38|nr:MULTISPECIES: class I SAM-dependent methyltransferase [unclassified Parabacteroides]
MDLGLVKRNIYFSNLTERLLLKFFDYDKPHLDYAGGYGLFVRLMRDKGFNFYRQDKYCENIFSKHFDINDTSTSHFEVLTAFEVFEHLVKPVEELNTMLKNADNVIFSTEITPNNIVNDWWYFSPETGQHISFYSIKSLEILAKYHGLFYYTNGINMHLFTKKQHKKNPFKTSVFDIKYRVLPFIERIYTKYNHKVNRIKIHSKLEEDYNYIKDESSF